MWIRIEPVREIWVDRIFPMKREIFGLIRGVTMASAGCSLNTEEKGSGGVTLSLLFNTTQNFPDYWHFSQQHDAARRARECERREAGVNTRESGMSWVTEIPVMTSFTLTALSNHADIYTEMECQPRPNVLSSLIWSAAFNANLLWIFHLSFIMLEYNCIRNQCICIVI